MISFEPVAHTAFDSVLLFRDQGAPMANLDHMFKRQGY